MKLAKMFSDHMIVQRDRGILVWGTGTEGEQITVSLTESDTGHRKTHTGVAVVSEGAWNVVLPPICAQTGAVLTVRSESETIVVSDVAAGEVWLAGGQSNMSFRMAMEAHLKEEIPACRNSMLRYFECPALFYEGQEDEYTLDTVGHWRLCDPENLAYFCAVGYYFEKALQDCLQVPVGVIGCSQAGTTAAAWMSEQALLKHGRPILDAYEKVVDAIDDMDDYVRRFKQTPLARPFGAGFEGPARPEGPDAPESAPAMNEKMMPQDMMAQIEAFIHGPLSPFRPSGLFTFMVRRIAPYPIRGVIWYQGESDTDDPHLYRYLFEDLAAEWRGLWQIPDMPFITAQLAPLKAFMNTDVSAFPVIRDAQEQCAKELPNVYMVSTSDVGMPYDIHPKNKKTVGERMALVAKAHVYGMPDVLCDAPAFGSVDYDQGSLVITVDHAGDGLYLKEKTDDTPLFFVNDAAVAEEQMTVSGQKIRLEAEPAAHYSIRFAKTDYYEVNICNSAGIAMLPFEAKLEIGD